MSERDDLRPIVVQDVRNNNVLMLAYANDETIRLSRETGFMHYWSRSREKIWRKGEESGNVQRLISLHEDCDRDALLARVEQHGVACHSGSYSCFSDRPFEQKDAISVLFEVFEERRINPPPGSYVASLQKDPDKLLQKVGEEATELILASKDKNREAMVHEAADLLFHFLLLLHSSGLRYDDVLAELQRRRK